MVKVLESYKLNAEGIELDVDVIEQEGEFVKIYYVGIPELGTGTKALLHDLKKKLITETHLSPEKTFDVKFVSKLKSDFTEKAAAILNKELVGTAQKTKDALVGILLNEMLGLGPIEFLLADGNVEEIVVNSAVEPIWVYHKKHGWLRTNIVIASESEIQNYSSIIARRVGKQITTLSPLLDAHLVTGDRANATLFPISNKGNTITIRRFRREPWTVTDFIENKTATSEIMALIWLAMEYELNILMSGGTASGKTSFLNVCMPFMPPNHRILTLEDTRELSLPEFLHWVPLTTRSPNPEGKGGVSLLDLLVNSLRMRPDRIIVGEIRRKEEAEVMFEAMHTGHSVYTTVHANTANDTIRRLVNPPIEIPVNLLEAVHLNVVMFRNRRIGVRRVFEVAEFITEKATTGTGESMKPNLLYRWRPTSDTITKYSDSIRLFDELALHTGLSVEELKKELKKKQIILEWMVKTGARHISQVGKIMAQYYAEPDEILKMAVKGQKPQL